MTRADGSSGRGGRGADPVPEEEEPLTGGNVAVGVVRVGRTVRKPRTPATPSVAALLHHLEAVGFDAAPRHLGLDGQGRQVLEFVPGVTADRLAPLDLVELGRLGRLVRRLHDATAAVVVPGARWQVEIPSSRQDVLCHHDLAPWNLVRDGARWVFVDWDGAGPGSRGWDLGYAATTFLPLQAGGDPDLDGVRLRALVDGYGLDEGQRRRLPGLTAAHTRGMYDLLRRGHREDREPWSRLWAEGHGDHWGPAAEYVERHRDRWAAVLLGETGRS